MAAVSWTTEPALTQTWANFLTSHKDRDEHIGTMDFGSDTNIPTNFIRWSSGSDKWEKWNGSSWDDLSSKYLIDVDTVDGIHASGFALIAHVGASGVSEHAIATGSVAGFMSAADKTILDAAVSIATVSTLMKRDASGRAQVVAPNVAADIARKDNVDAVQTNLDTHDGGTGATHGLATTSVAGFMSSALWDKLNAIEALATVDQTAAEILAALLGVDGSGSLLDADLLDGLDSSAFITVVASDTAGNDGFVKWSAPSTLTLQWGQISVAGNTITQTTLPLTLAAHHAAAGGYNITSTGDNGNVSAYAKNTTQIGLGNGIGSTKVIHWVSLGDD